MQAIILAAGMGKRLMEITNDQTKCMVKVNGTTLIEHCLNIITLYPISKIILVIGYKGDKLREFIGNEYNNIPVEYVKNDIYDKTNNIYSLYLTKEYLEKEDTILIESDLIFEKKIIDKLWNDSAKDVALVNKYESWMDGTVVEIDNENHIVNFLSKNEFKFNDVDNYYKTVNIYKFSKEFLKDKYIPFLEAYCKSKGLNEYYEQVLKVITFLDKKNIKVCKLDNGEKWYEIDDKQDLNNAETIFSTGIEKYQNRYGGYWRFPKLIDFCYLVNPYFPTSKMECEFKCYFDTLLRQYPSGHNIQNILAAKMFNCKEEDIIVGNGAAELINSLMTVLNDKKVGVIYPTFQEYPARLIKDNVIKIFAKEPNFSYNIELIKENSDKADVFLLINPDNPSGNFIKKEDVVALANYLKEKNKLLLLDESFVDFAEGGESNSLINEEILEEHHNLIIMKSISKSYGVPGIRLGILVSKNQSIIEATKSNLSIWNINSYGEFFLQIFGKYHEDYKDACVKIANERDRFLKELQKIKYLRTIPSQANYFLCEVIGKNTKELSEHLLKQNILIKDCSSKEGFSNKPYIRLAVRDENDNNLLIRELKTIE